MFNDLKKFTDKYSEFKERYESIETFERTDLCDIMEKNMSDKSYPKDLKENESYYIKQRRKKPGHIVGFHNYTIFYDAFFKHMREKEINLFEIGLGSNTPGVEGWMGENARPGASIYGWSEYFSKGKIYGADIDEKAIFQDPDRRIATYVLDQKNAQDSKNIFSQINKKMDIIVDDGRHWPDYNLAFFKNTFQYLKTGGLFITEDLYLDKHSRGNFKKMHYDNLKYIKLKARFADILRLKSKYGPKDSQGLDKSNNLMVILK